MTNLDELAEKCMVFVDRRWTIFEANGTFTSSPHDIQAKVYLSGEWEKKIPSFK